jgi:hypothetical protein
LREAGKGCSRVVVELYQYLSPVPSSVWDAGVVQTP